MMVSSWSLPELQNVHGVQIDNVFFFFFQEVRVNNGPQSIRVKDSGLCFIHAWRKELRQQIWHEKDVLDDKIYQTNVAI